MNLPDAAPRQYSPLDITVVWEMAYNRGPVESLAWSIKALRDLHISHMTSRIVFFEPAIPHCRCDQSELYTASEYWLEVASGGVPCQSGCP